MRYEVRPTEAALEDVDAIRDWIAAQGAPLTAWRWVEGLLDAFRRLEERPARCRLAPENEIIDGAEVRQLLVGRFRVLFTVSRKQVFILHVRRGSRHNATKKDLEHAIAELDSEEGG